MTRPDFPIIDPQRLGDSFSSWRENLAFPLQKLQTDVRQMLGGGLLRKDNSLCALIDLNFNNQLQLTSGVERLIANPLAAKGATPIGFTPWYAEDANGNPLTIAGWKFNPAPKDTNGTKLPGFVGITVNFDLQHTLPCLIKTASGNQSINNNLSTAISGWDTATKSRGSVITDDGSTFTVSEAGTYNVSFHTAFQGGVTYSAMQIWIFANGLASYADLYLPVATTDEPEMQVSGTVDLAAGGTLRALCFQTNAALATRTVSGGTNGRRIMIHRLYNDTVQQGRVIGVLEVG